MENPFLWPSSVSTPVYPMLAANEIVGIRIVCGGIAGRTIVCTLLQAGF